MLSRGSMEILMVTAELQPFLSATDAADAVATLSRTLAQLGHQVTVAAPLPKSVESSGMMVARRLSGLELPDGALLTIHDAQLPSGVRVVFFEAEGLEARGSVFADEAGKDFADNAERAVLLCQAAAALVRSRVGKSDAFDVVHAHDWSAAFIPYLLRGVVPAILTVHSLQRNVTLALKDLPEVPDVKGNETMRDAFRLGSRANLLKGAVLGADVAVCPSASVACDMCDVDVSGALGAALSASGKEIVGIAGGIDYSVCNPSTDTALVSRYDAESSDRKAISKAQLFKERGWGDPLERPLVVFTGSMDKDSGAELLQSSLPELLGFEVCVMVVGSGAKSRVKLFDSAKLKRFENYHFDNSTRRADERRLLAAADIAVLPARGDCIGNAVRRAQRYGVVPVTLAAGAQRDCVVDCDADLSSGTGFLFDEASAEAMLGTVKRALTACKTPAWGRLRRRVMRLDLSWDRGARRYLQLYRAAGGAGRLKVA